MIKSVAAGAVAMAVVSSGVNVVPTISQRQGKVTFNGTVVDAPYSISQELADQSIDFGQPSRSFLKAGGTSKPMDLDIELVNCDIIAFKQGQAAKNGEVQLSFTGPQVTGQVEELTINGSTGTVVVVQAADKNVSSDGTAGDAYPLRDGNNVLHYTVLVKKVNGGTVSEGAFSVVATFNLSYQ